MRGQRLAANYDGWFAGVPVHINQLELRDRREYDLGKRSNTFRILVLGDSVTFGHGSVYETTYPALLEERLRRWRPDVDWQVWNAAVPGYNTSQELAHLLEVAPRFQPDLVVVGFYENDLIDNNRRRPPGRCGAAARRRRSRDVTSIRSSSTNGSVYVTAVAAVGDRRLSAPRRAAPRRRRGIAGRGRRGGCRLRPEQALTPFERLTDAQVRDVNCVYGMKPNPGACAGDEASAGLCDWQNAVRGFQQRIQRSGHYRIVFFLNVVPPACGIGDVFYDATRLVNAFYTQTFSEAAPTVSVHDAFLHVRPSQMPGAARHAHSATPTSSRRTCCSPFCGNGCCPMPWQKPGALEQRSDSGRDEHEHERLHRDGVAHVGQHRRDGRRHVQNQQQRQPDRRRRAATPRSRRTRAARRYDGRQAIVPAA